MRKITLFLALIGMISLTSCTVEETTVVDNGFDSDTISEVWEYSNVDFGPGNGYSVFLDFPHPTFTSDMILVYHLYDVVNGTDIWRLMPQTYYFENGGELDYNYDFTIYDANVFLDANFNLNSLSNVWTQNQVFRVVVIPGFFGNKNNNPIDFTDFNKTMEHLNLNESDVKKVNKTK